MCYVCSPKCDNCMPKVLLCPQCGEKCLLAMDVCPQCGEALTQGMKNQAVQDWNAGKRFFAKNGGKPPAFALEMKRRLEDGAKRETD